MLLRGLGRDEIASLTGGLPPFRGYEPSLAGRLSVLLIDGFFCPNLLWSNGFVFFVYRI